MDMRSTRQPRHHMPDRSRQRRASPLSGRPPACSCRHQVPPFDHQEEKKEDAGQPTNIVHCFQGLEANRASSKVLRKQDYFLWCNKSHINQAHQTLLKPPLLETPSPVDPREGLLSVRFLGEHAKRPLLYPPSTLYLTSTAHLPHTLLKTTRVWGAHRHRTGWRLVGRTLRVDSTVYLLRLLWMWRSVSNRRTHTSM